VLRIDPLDSEAQLLWGELEQQQPAHVRPTPTLEAFSRALVERLKEQSTPHLMQKDHLLIRLRRGAVARFNLEALFIEATSDNSVDDGAALVARDLAERSLGLPPGRVHLLTRVLPVVRDSNFLERGVGAIRREAPAGLWYFYALEDPEVVLYVPEGILPSYRATLEQVDRAAWENLEGRAASLKAIDLEGSALQLSSDPTGLWAFAQGDGHDAARLFTRSHQELITRQLGDGPLRVYLGLRELVLFCRESDRACVSKLDQFEVGRDGIPGVWRLDAGRLTSIPD
jgi:hypothetical protein